MHKVSKSRAILLVSVFAGALWLSADAVAESHLYGGGSGRSSARDASGNVPGVCDLVSAAPVLPPPRLGSPSAPEGLNAPGIPPSANNDTPRGDDQDSPTPKKKKKTTKSKQDDGVVDIKTAKADPKPPAPVEKPKPEVLAKLSPKDKIKALLKGNGCNTCHSPPRVDSEGEILEDRQRIAEILLGTAKDYVSPDDTMTERIASIQKELGELEKDILRNWAAGQQ